MRPSTRQSLAALIATAAFAGLAYVVIAPFLVPIAWAAVLSYATWPLYRRLLALLAGRAGLAAGLMTLAVVLALVLPVGGLTLALADDIALTYRTLRQWSQMPPALPAWARELPVIGQAVTGWYDAIRSTPGGLERVLAERVAGWSQALLATAGDVGRNLGRLVLTLLTLFFLYRHGEELAAQTQRVAERLAGASVKPRLALIGRTVRGVCYGVLLTALAQGVLAGLGFWLMGIRGAVLLGVLTAMLALLPFGPPVLWLPVALWTLLTVSTWKGVVLLLWGALVVSGIDNVLRPYLIGGATQAPFLLVFFGVLGGLASFGLIGLFVGPTVLAVVLAVWREWANADRPATDPGDAV
jgi:predicted PurR-regulated permease PerM